ncbi:MAG: hypothetical protein HRU37_10285, partial [Roseibacillus sp.]|nr:hypothetical protein [Roseibacillus sp.]
MREDPNTNGHEDPRIGTKIFLAGVVLVLFLFPTEQLAAGTVELANDRVSLSFDEKTGALISLKNVATGDEYLKGPTAGGNPFRAYIDTKDILPPAAKAGMPFSVTPV